MEALITSSDIPPDDAARSRKQAKVERTFVCGWSECQRVFGKLEHLQRHERSHAGDARYECPTCKKRFVRRDVLARHTALHMQTSSNVKKSSKVSCVACATLKTRCDSQSEGPCIRCMSSGSVCVYRNTRRSTISYSENSAATTSPQQQGSVVSSNGQEPVNDTSLQIPVQTLLLSDGLQSPGSLNTANSAFNEGLATPDSMPSISEDLSTLPLDSLYGFMMEPFESYFGWDMGDGELDHMKTLNTHAPNTPPVYWIPGNGLDAAALLVQASASSLSHSAIRDAQPADSPWPHVYRPSSTDGRLKLPPVSHKPQTTLDESYLNRVEECAREAMLSLINLSHQSHWNNVDVAAFPSTQMISVCVNLYFRHFHDTLPIIRRSTFRVSEVPPVLLLAIAAIGAIYLGDGLNGLAVALNELTRRAIAYLRESDGRTMFETYLVQAWLLQSVFGLFCGSRILYQHAEISRGALVTAVRRKHLLRPSLSFVEELSQRRETPTPEELRRAFADDEERRRLGWGIYLFDTQISCLLNISPLFSIGEIDMPLPSDEDTWNEPLSGTKFDSDLQYAKSSNFRVILDSLLSTGKLPQPLNPFGLSLVAHTLYRLCTDACQFHSILSQPWAQTESAYRLAFPSTFNHNPQELLDKLSSSCYIMPSTPTSLIVSVSALSHLGHIQFTWPGFLDNIKIAAGKSGTESSKNHARLCLSSQISGDPIGARSILVHAGQLNALLMRFTFDTPSETVWTFDTALTFWAIVKFGTGVGGTSSSEQRTSVTWSDRDEVESWTRNGGPVSFQGLGDFAELTIPKILSIFSDRLQNTPWGIAQRFKHVLTNLSKE